MWKSSALGQLHLLTETQHRVLSIWGQGSGLVSQVSHLGNPLGVVGIKRKKKEQLCSKGQTDNYNGAFVLGLMA